MDVQTLGEGEWKLLDFLSSGRTFYHSRGREEQSTFVQGTASDIAKEAMIEVSEVIDATDQARQVRLVLIVHDELVLEVPFGQSEVWEG
jgi:DNA polymerase I-like protein with 3'-5' exonuclease and polymerase domains